MKWQSPLRNCFVRVLYPCRNFFLFISKCDHLDRFKTTLLTVERQNSTSLAKADVYSLPEEMRQSPGVGKVLSCSNTIILCVDIRSPIWSHLRLEIPWSRLSLLVSGPRIFKLLWEWLKKSLHIESPARRDILVVHFVCSCQWTLHCSQWEPVHYWFLPALLLTPSGCCWLLYPRIIFKSSWPTS